MRLAFSSLKNATSCRELVLPSILEAAVATDQKDSVVEMLETYRATGILDTPTIYSTAQRRTAANALGAALRVAARLSRNNIGFQIIDFFRRHWISLGCLVSSSNVDGMYEDCVKYGNTALYSTVLYWKREKMLPESSTNLGLRLSIFQFRYVHRRTLPTLIYHLVNTGILDLDYIDGELPLWVALKTGINYKAAKVLIDCGADINRILPGQQQTAYWEAYDGRDGDAQWYLIKWGADTRPMNEHGTPRTPESELAIPEIKLGYEYNKAWEDYLPERNRYF